MSIMRKKSGGETALFLFRYNPYDLALSEFQKEREKIMIMA